MVEAGEGSIDHRARRKLAEALRQFVSGQITNDQLENRYPSGRERGLQDVYLFGIWPLFDDVQTHKSVGKWGLTSEARLGAARVVLFLRSGQPYRYPIQTGLKYFPVALLSILTFGWYGKRHMDAALGIGEKAVWPFFSRSDYERALASPVYLRGSNSQIQDVAANDGRRD